MGLRGRHYPSLLLAVLSAGCGGGGDGPGIVNAPVVISVTVSQPTSSTLDIGGTVQLTVDVQVQNGASQTVDWSSSAPNVATVSQSGLVTAVAGGQAVITATSTANRSKTGTVTITVSPPRVVGVSLSTTGTRSIRIGDTFPLTATVDTRGTIAKTVAFSSSNSAVATVSSTDGLTGNIVGVAVGQTTITATSTADATKNATLTVQVTGTVRITNITPNPASVRVGSTVKIVPTVQADPGLSPAVTFQSQNTAIATVANDGTVTGVALGQTFIVIRSVGDPNVSATIPIAVRSGITSVTMSVKLDTLRRGASHQLGATVVADAGVSTAINYSAANNAIATIDASARVTGVGVGQTYVRALSAVDPTVGDSALVVVVDPCLYYQAFPFGTNISGTVTDVSCNGTTELYAFQLNTQTTIAVGATVQFPANFTFINDKSGYYFFQLAAGTSATGFAVATTNRYSANVSAQSASQRGAFTIVGVTNPSLTSTCGIVGTTGITVQVPMNLCSFQPQGKPVATYYSFTVGVLPFIPAGQQVTFTITTPAPIVPLVELRWGGAAPIQVTGTGQTLVQSFTAPAGGAFASLTLTSRDPNQNGNVSVKVDGPPSISYDAFVFGSGAMERSGRGQPLRPPDRHLAPFVLQQPLRP